MLQPVWWAAFSFYSRTSGLGKWRGWPWQLLPSFSSAFLRYGGTGRCLLSGDNSPVELGLSQRNAAITSFLDWPIRLALFAPSYAIDLLN
jgi:hypothetical protein